MNLHSLHCNLNILLPQLIGPLDQPVKQDEAPSGITKIQDPDHVFPKLSSQLSDSPFNLRRIWKWEGRTHLLEQLDDCQGLGSRPPRLTGKEAFYRS